MAGEQAGTSDRRLFTQEDIPGLDWKSCVRTEPTRARLLTETDFEERGGVVQTKEKAATFKPGDYLGVGVDGEEYPISKETMETTKRRINEPGGDGFALFESTETVYAARIKEPFATKRGEDVLEGKPGDYLLFRLTGDGGARMWIVDVDIFGRTYKFIEPDKNYSGESLGKSQIEGTR